MNWDEKTITEKVSYIKGLADGLKLGDSPEAQLIKVIVDVLDDIALSVCDVEDELDMIQEQVDAVDESLADLEEFVFDDEDGCGCGCGCDCDCDCDCGCGCGDDDDDCCCFDVECPTCGETFCVDEETLLDGSVNCPNCNELLTFDLEEGDDEDDED